MKPRVDFHSIHRILVIRLRMIGDVLLTTPAVSAMRAALPDARIAYLTGSPAREILDHNPDIDDILVYDRRIFRTIVEQTPFDLAVNFDGSDISQYACELSGAKYRIGMRGGGAVKLRKIYNVATIPLPRGSDVIGSFLNLTRSLGIDDRSPKTTLILTDEERRSARAFLDRHAPNKKIIIGIHPGGYDVKSLWKTENFAGLADRLTEDPAVCTLIFQGPGEAATAAAVFDKMKRRNRAVLVPLRSLREYAALVGACGIFIAHNRAPVHIAAALGAKVLGIYGARQAPFWFPYEERDGRVYLQKDDINRISIGEVLSVCQGLMNRRNRRP